ncbi:MAG: hypothetical protein NWF08_05195 [Candidatus Bathyarchaeota archaeon]|nr:hypothetical protein [Candidatus Bathyarchaeota archaeon]
MSILGTRAGLISDLNLLLQIVIIIIIFAGFFYAKRKIRYDMHGKIMGIAVFLNLLSLIFVMVPGTIGGLSSLASRITQPTILLMTIHKVFGGLAEILGIIFIIILRPCGSKFIKNTRYLMRTTLAFWIIAFLLGVIAYIIFNVL